MKQITIISGKGGTGKTTITAAFAALGKNQVMADADVDAADLHLILKPSIQKEELFYGGRAPGLDRDKCNECGLCEEECRFEAIRNFTIDPILRRLRFVRSCMSPRSNHHGRKTLRPVVHFPDPIRPYGACPPGHC